MASQTLRPHRSPSPSPSPATPTMSSSNAAKLTRQSLGPPPTSTGAAKGFGGLGVSSPTTSQPRHVSTGGAMNNNGNHRDSFGSSRPSLGNTPRGAPSGARPSSEFLPGFRDTKTPEAEQIDQWFKHLASWEQTLEEMAAASTDQNFTEELGAIEQWFRVLSEAERTAALYSLLQHSTPIQIRFFSSVLQHMSQADPLSAILSPNPNSAAGFAAQMDKMSSFKSPSAGGGNGYTGSPNPTPTQGGQYLNPDDAQRAKMRQNRISAPGTLQPHDRWQGQQLDQVLERGPSPDNHSSRSRSPAGDSRPKSEAYAGARGNYNQQQQERSPRPSGVGLGLDAPISPLLSNPSWASMVNTPLAPVFHDGKSDGLTSALNMANMQLAASKVALDDARKYRRPAAGGMGPASRNVSGQSDESSYTGRATSPLLSQYNQYSRSPALDQFGGLGLGDTSALAGLGMNFAQLGLNPLAATQAQAQMLALAQAQQQLGQNQAYASAGFQGQGGYTSSRPGPGPGVGGGMGGGRPSQTQGRRSPMPGNRHSPTPQAAAAAAAGAGGGAGGGAGVAGPDDVDPKVIEDTAGWLRVLRLHKYTSTFEKTPWKTLVMMTDADLQDQGVAAQGARTKFLKVFHNVRTHLEIPHPPGQEEFAQKADGKA